MWESVVSVGSVVLAPLPFPSQATYGSDLQQLSEHWQARGDRCIPHHWRGLDRLPCQTLTPWHCGRPQVTPPNFWSKAAPTEGCVLEKTCPEHGEVTGLCQGRLAAHHTELSCVIVLFSSLQIRVIRTQASHFEGRQGRSEAAWFWEDSCRSLGTETLVWVKFH